MHHPVTLTILVLSMLIGVTVWAEELTIPIKKAPYKVLIVESRNRSNVIGSGAILSETWMITTATSIKDHRKKPTSLMVRCGSGVYNLYGGLHYVKKIVVHPDFSVDGPTGQGDVALLKLLYTFHTNLTVAPAPVAPNVTPAGTTAHLISWPLIGGQRSLSLKALAVSTMDWVECRKAFSNQTGITLGETTMCTEPLLEFQAQEGDPLVTSGVLTGLYRNVNLSRKLDLPQCYVDVSSFSSWIDEHID